MSSAVTALDALDRACKLAELMHNETHRLTDELVAVEEKLVRLNIGVFTEVTISVDGPTKTTLAYGKFHGRWGLYIRSFDETGAATATSAIANATRQNRVLAAENLRSLLHSFEPAAQTALDRVQSAYRTVSSLFTLSGESR